jgi:hypothetical protein
MSAGDEKTEDATKDGGRDLVKELREGCAFSASGSPRHCNELMNEAAEALEAFQVENWVSYECPECGLAGHAPVGTKIGCAGAMAWGTAHDPVDFTVVGLGAIATFTPSPFPPPAAEEETP